MLLLLLLQLELLLLQLDLLLLQIDLILGIANRRPTHGTRASPDRGTFKRTTVRSTDEASDCSSLESAKGGPCLSVRTGILACRKIQNESC